MDPGRLFGALKAMANGHIEDQGAQFFRPARFWTGESRALSPKSSITLKVALTEGRSYRYDTNGFVEELAELPAARAAHACATLPATGVRPAQPSLTPRRFLSLADRRMDSRKTFFPLC